jgi:uncharacterized OB-fold protein
MSETQAEPVEILRCPVKLDYLFSAGQSASRFLRAIAEGRLLGQRCPVDGRVYFPTRGSCPQHGVLMTGDPVELSDKGTVVTYSINRVPSENIKLDLPYAPIQVLLDGADTILMHVLGECPIDQVHMGMRVQAVWKPREEWTTSIGNIRWFKPSGEPDAPFDRYKEHI